MATDAGLTTPAIAVEGLSNAPMSTPDTTRITSDPSSTGVSAPTRKVSGRCGPEAKSQSTSTIVCTAIPPMRFPAAIARLPREAAEIVIASSGQAARDREQEDPAELVSEAEANVEG